MEKRTILFVVLVSLSFLIVHALFDPPRSHTENPIVKEMTSNERIEQGSSSFLSDTRDDLLSHAAGSEEFFVLENEYQQLVFSSRGGALVEVNLPFLSKNNTHSFVKRVDLDRQLLELAPRNAQFPLFPAHIVNESGIRVSYEPKLGGFYPLLRRPLLHRDGSVQTSLEPRFYALNLLNNEGDLSSVLYQVTQFDRDKISFEATYKGCRVTKTYSIPKEGQGPYCFDLALEILGNAPNCWLSSGVPEVELVSGSSSPVLRYQVTRGKANEVENIDLSDKTPSKELSSIVPDWVSNSNGFLGLIVGSLGGMHDGLRAERIPAAQIPTRLTLVDPSTNQKYPGYSAALPVKEGKQLFRVFAGPYDDRLLKDLNHSLAGETPPNYENAKSMTGWFSFISEPFSQFLSFLLNIFYQVTRSWGISIILLTVALRIMMYPLNTWSIRSTLKMQLVAPKVAAIRERFKKDPKRGQMEIMNFYRTQGINPFSGCLPMLLQMPFLIGMFYLLKSSVQLRGAAFIPGWIDNLAAPDVVFSWSTPILLIGNQLHLLPLLLGLVTYLQQRATTKSGAQQASSELQQQQKMMGWLMPVFLTVMFYGFPAGLNIYFISSTLLGILQQWFVGKRLQLAQ